jgi:hypothetical protein
VLRFHYPRPYCPLDELLLRYEVLRSVMVSRNLLYWLGEAFKCKACWDCLGLNSFRSIGRKDWWSTTPPLKINLVLQIPTLRERAAHHDPRPSLLVDSASITPPFSPFYSWGVLFPFGFPYGCPLQPPVARIPFQGTDNPCYPIVDVARPTFHAQSNSVLAPRSRFHHSHSLVIGNPTPSIINH